MIGVSKVKPFTNERNDGKKTKFSIIVPFRNESNRIQHLLNTLKTIDYPKSHYEVLFIDDHSDDNSRETIVNSLKYSNIDFSILQNKINSISPKKEAITIGVDRSKYPWIVSTDADCYLPELWLDSFNTIINSKQPGFIIAPVTYSSNGSFFENFQLMDFLSLQCTTIGSFGLGYPFLCNGANLVYNKHLFLKYNGFLHNTTVVSGDDVFLLQKFRAHDPNKVVYLKSYDAIVVTKPVTNFNSLLQQHVRWASKMSSYDSVFGQLTGFFVFIMNALLVSLLLLTISGIIHWSYFLSIFLLKLIIDFIYLSQTSRFFKQHICLQFFPLHNILYSFFSVLVVFYAMFFKYKWKGRMHKK